MAVIVTVLAYALQLAALLALPALLYVCLGLRRSKKTAGVAALLCVAVIFFGAAWLAFHPVCSCPRPLKPYLTEERWQEILSATPPIWNWNLPFFPAVITIERATEDLLYWKVDWFPAGTTRMGVTPDGYDPVHGLFG